MYTRGHAISGRYLYRDPLSHRYLAARFHAGKVALSASIDDLESPQERHTTAYTQDGNAINIQWYSGTALAGACRLAPNHSTLTCSDITLRHQVGQPTAAAALYTETLGRFPWAIPPALAFVALWFIWRPWVLRFRRRQAH
ncbi:MAG: hypothetical protein KGJ62_09590 [Armatimonadetes bacterium]|nr:hypothetical protein [Armatimonadota bacterium]MDE2205802.1 hypothetical protein [Armatimonadota bacterium]